jgi:hypothetical protein
MKKPNPLLEDLKSILPTIAANAFQAEQDRKVPDENIALLKASVCTVPFSRKPSVAWSYRCPSLPIALPCSRGPVPVLPGP